MVSLLIYFSLAPLLSNVISVHFFALVVLSGREGGVHVVSQETGNQLFLSEACEVLPVLSTDSLASVLELTPHSQETSC